MILELNPKHGFEVWINQKMVETIEEAFKRVLETDELNYYYIPCQCEKGYEKNETKWMGKVSLIDFIKKVQKVDNHFCPIGVTNAKNKKELLNYFENHFHDRDSKVWDYWIGDAVHQKMVCGDDLFIKLWDRVRDQATKGATTNKNYF